MSNTESFEAALDRFMAAVQAHINNHYATNYQNIKPPILECMRGPRYVRVVRQFTGDPYSRSAFCFIDKTTGDVLKADGWRSPAKGVRGTIYTTDFEKYGVNEYGAKYAC